MTLRTRNKQEVGTATSMKTQKGGRSEEKRKRKSKLNVIIVEFGSYLIYFQFYLAGRCSQPHKMKIRGDNNRPYTSSFPGHLFGWSS